MGQLNLELLTQLAKRAKLQPRPFIMMGDWNIEAEVLQQEGQGWLSAIGAQVMAPGQPTCFSGKAHSTLDYFVVHGSLVQQVQQITVQPAAFKTHMCVLLAIQGTDKRRWTWQLKMPKTCPAIPPHGCMQQQDEWQRPLSPEQLRSENSDEHQQMLDDALSQWLVQYDHHMAALCQVVNSPSYLGRGKETEYIRRPVFQAATEMLPQMA